jgi:hypothetical protein
MLIDVPGGRKRADAIRTDDWVASRNEFDPDGPVEYRQVEEVFVHTAEIWNLHSSDQIIETTAKHPFHVPGVGWVEAASLRIGDFVSGRNGQLLLVRGLAPSGSVQNVYNWRIADHHTYFVSAATERHSIWAHNACSSTSGETAAARTGRAKHIELSEKMQAAGNRGQTTLPSGKRVDGLKFNKKPGTGGIVYEYKPRANPRSRARGMAQLNGPNGYVAQVAARYSGTWRGIVIFY